MDTVIIFVVMTLLIGWVYYKIQVDLVRSVITTSLNPKLIYERRCYCLHDNVVTLVSSGVVHNQVIVEVYAHLCSKAIGDTGPLVYLQIAIPQLPGFIRGHIKKNIFVRELVKTQVCTVDYVLVVNDFEFYDGTKPVPATLAVSCENSDVFQKYAKATITHK